MKKLLFALGLVAGFSSAALASGPQASRHHAANEVDPVVASFVRAGLMTAGEIRRNDSGDDQVVASFERAGIYPPVPTGQEAGGGREGDYDELIISSFARAGLLQPETIASGDMAAVPCCN